MDEKVRAAWMEERQRVWDEGFTLYAKDMLPPERSELDFLTEPEWLEVRRLLEAGYTLGIVAHQEEPVTFMAEIANHLNGIPLRAYCDDYENVLYVRAKDADTRRANAWIASNKHAAKPRKQRAPRKRRSA